MTQSTTTPYLPQPLACAVPMVALVTVLLLAFLPTMAQAQGNGSLSSATYLMAYHACDTTTGTSYCNGKPEHHATYIAGSDDGGTWQTVAGWSTWSGSVPDLIRRNDTLYVYNASTTMRRIDVASGSQSSATVSIRTAAGATVSFVDPSPILDSDGRIVLFYLNSTGSTTDPASCASFTNCVKIFSSATEVIGSNGTQFIQDDGDRVRITLTGVPPALAASDPDIFAGPSGFILLISQGNNVLAFQSTSLKGSYTSIPGLSGDLLVNNAGGVPAGYYDEASGEYWIYVHKSASSSSPTSIRRARTSSLSTTLTSTQFNEILTGTGAGLGAAFSVESPGFLRNTAASGSPPVLSNVEASASGPTSAHFAATSDKSGTLFWLVTPAGSTAPSAAQIEAGASYGSVSVVGHGNSTAIAGTATAGNINGLTAATAYTLYLIVRDEQGTRSAVTSASFSTNQTVDTTPDPFSFTPRSGVSPGSEVTSDAVTITGINTPVIVTVTGGQFAIDNGAFSSAAGTLNAGQSLRARVTAPTAFSSSSTAVITVGDGSGNFTVTTHDGSNPDPFAFASVRGATAKALVTSESVTLTGLSGSRTANVSGGELSINGGTFSSSGGTVTNGAKLRVRLTASARPGGKVRATVSVGSSAATFDVRTRGGLSPEILLYE